MLRYGTGYTVAVAGVGIKADGSRAKNNVGI